MISLDPKKEIRDQILHFVAGIAITMLVGYLLGVVAGVLASTGIMYGREVIQRLKGGNPWYQCHAGCILDIVCWSVGTFTGSALLLWVL